MSALNSDVSFSLCHNWRDGLEKPREIRTNRPNIKIRRKKEDVEPKVRNFDFINLPP
jgi:hypothetical protein